MMVWRNYCLMRNGRELDANVHLEARMKGRPDVSTTTCASDLRHFGLAEFRGTGMCGAAQKAEPLAARGCRNGDDA